MSLRRVCFYTKDLGISKSLSTDGWFWKGLESWQRNKVIDWLRDLGVDPRATERVEIEEPQVLRVVEFTRGLKGRLFTLDGENLEQEELYVFFDETPDLEEL